MKKQSMNYTSVKENEFSPGAIRP